MTPDEKYSEQEVVILLVEDSPTQAFMIRNFLTEAGLRVIWANNGAMGVRLAREILPSLVVLDIQLPDLDGYQVCEQLKMDHATASIPVVMLTRQDSPEAVKQSMQSGAVDFIPKDAFTSVVLLEAVRQMGLMKVSTRYSAVF